MASLASNHVALSNSPCGMHPILIPRLKFPNAPIIDKQRKTHGLRMLQNQG